MLCRLESLLLRKRLSMNTFSAAWLLVVLSILSLSCKKDDGNCTTCPPPTKDPRTYSWTVDTISYPGSFQTTMRSIYATGPDNVYIVGHNDNPGTPTMFHYNGSQWTTTSFHVTAGGGISGAMSLSRVHGFGASDIWVAGERIYQIGNTFSDSSFLMHFDGTRWTETMIAGGRGRVLQSLWGATPNDIWAGGVNTLLHYDGVQWSHFPIEIPDQGIQFLSIAGLSRNDVYMTGSRRDASGNNDTVAFLLYRYDGVAWARTDSSIQVLGIPSPKFGVLLYAVNGTLYSVADGVYRKTIEGWTQTYRGISTIVSLAGTAETRMFAAGTQTQILYFNGTDWYSYPTFPAGNVDFYSVWTNSDNVFVVGNDGSTTFVARGK
jgi:hypothetical protein